jgi:hypothetical protein
MSETLRVLEEATGLVGWSHGLSQSDRHQGDRDNNRDDTERSESCRISRRKKELPDDPGRQPRHGVDTQDLPAGFLRRCAVEPALDDNEQPGKAESGQGTSYNPCVRIHYKQAQVPSLKFPRAIISVLATALGIPIIEPA